MPPPDLWDDPTADPSGPTLTPFHLFTFGSGALSLLAGNMRLPPDLFAFVGMWKRINALLVLVLVIHYFLMGAMKRYHNQISELSEIRDLNKELANLAKVSKKPTDWDNQSSHPSHFLTTRDAKPRLFPFPLGKAGGGATKGELWWEAGNAAHVGHFNPKEDPGDKENLRLKMEAREKARQKKADAAIKEYEGTRIKWHTRLTHIKTIGAIVAISMFHRTLGTICLVAFVYYVFATKLFRMLKPAEEEEEFIPVKRKPVSLAPGMGMTYIYEPATSGGGVKPTGQMPVKAPTNRLITSFDSRYAS